MGTVWAATGSAATAATAATATAANSIKSLPLKLEGCGYRQVGRAAGCRGVVKVGTKICSVARKTGKLNKWKLVHINLSKA